VELIFFLSVMVVNVSLQRLSGSELNIKLLTFYDSFRAKSPLVLLSGRAQRLDWARLAKGISGLAVPPSKGN